VTDSSRLLRTIGVTLLVVTAAAALGALLVRDQISRHRRDLFSPHPLRRLAAISYLAGVPASIDLILLLRDYSAWETRPMLRKRATSVVSRMEESLATRALEAI